MITIHHTIIDYTDQVGFIQLKTCKIRAWARSNEKSSTHSITGHIHGSMMEFPIDTPIEDAETAVRERVAEMQRIYENE